MRSMRSMRSGFIFRSRGLLQKVLLTTTMMIPVRRERRQQVTEAGIAHSAAVAATLLHILTEFLTQARRRFLDTIIVKADLCACTQPSFRPRLIEHADPFL
jgi:hypothetical protein